MIISNHIQIVKLAVVFTPTGAMLKYKYRETIILHRAITGCEILFPEFFVNCAVVPKL